MAMLALRVAAALVLITSAPLVFCQTRGTGSTRLPTDAVDYIVGPGEYLIGIANARLIDGASTENLQWLRSRNGLRNVNRLVAGQMIRLPIAQLRTIDEAVRVVDAHGQAELDGTTLVPGTVIAPGQRVNTGAGGGVVLELADGSRIWIRESSQLRLERATTAPGLDYSTAEVEVPAGRIQAIIRKLQPGTRFKVRTPSAVLGVRGTDFRASAESGTDTSRMEVLEGMVDAASASRPSPVVDVQAGFGTVVVRNEPPSVPRRLLSAPEISGLPALQERPVVRFSLPALAEAAAYRGEIVDPVSARIITSTIFKTPELSFPGLPDGRYALAARGVDAQGLEGYGATHAFTLKARPEPPFQTRPADRSTLRGDQVEFVWGEVQGARYRMQIATRADFSAIETDERGLEAAGRTQPLKPGEYYWRLATIDATGDQGPFGQARRFELRPIPPAASVSPPKVEEDRLTLSWQGEPGQSFEINVARNAAFSDEVQTHSTTRPELVLEQLEPGDWYVRIRATESDGYVGAFSPTQKFAVPQPPMPWWIYLLPFLPLLFL